MDDEAILARMSAKPGDAVDPKKIERDLGRLYGLGDEPLATPVVNGISKVYVPLTTDDFAELGEDFIEAAVAHIKRIGGYGEDQARRIATNVASLSDTDDVRVAAAEMAERALAAWGASDPRIAEAIAAAAEEVTGVERRPRP